MNNFINKLKIFLKQKLCRHYDTHFISRVAICDENGFVHHIVTTECHNCGKLIKYDIDKSDTRKHFNIKKRRR